MTQFIDRYAKIGRPFKAPKTEMEMSAQPFSRSLQTLSKEIGRSGNIHCSIKGTTLNMDVTEVMGDKIKVKKKDAIELAKWIMEGFNV